MSKLLLVLLLLVGNVAHANPLQDELLEGDKAFQLTTRVVDGNTVEASWKVAKGYYLYREKFKFEPQDDGVLVKDVALPPGKRKRDEFFGDVETYRDQVKALVRLGRNDSAARTLKLKITSQGCADIGVCYPPIIKTVELKLPAAKGAAPAGEAAAPESLQNLGDLLGGQDEFLEPDKAFVVSAQAQGNNAMVQFQIAPGYYLYRDKMKIAPGPGSDIKLGAVELPPGKVKVDEFFGKTEVYYDNVAIAAPITGDVKTANLTVHYQGCAEKGICYPPQTKQIKVSLDGNSAIGNSAAPPAGEPPTGVTGKAFWLAVFAAFGTGLLLTFTPCVLPMIPILSSIIVGQGAQLSKWRGGVLSGMYVLGTAVTYTIAGVLAGATGDQLQAYFQNVWAIGLFASLFVLLALSMFGFYELQMPSFIQSRLQTQAQNIKGGSLVGVFVMGLVSALIVGACVSPLLISGLAVAISNKDPVLGGAIMFAMALGMGAILIAIGVGASWLLPRAGGWMNTVKHVFGVLLLAVAIYLLGALPQVPVLYLWGALFVVVGVYLGATQSLPAGVSGWRYLWKGVGTLSLLWGVFALLGALAGNRDILHPIDWRATAVGGAAAPAGAQASAAHPQFQRITTEAQLEQALAKARSDNKAAIVDFYASWCTDCVRMERTTFADPRVVQALSRFALIQVDVTENNADARAVKQRVGVLGPPAMLFFDAQGQEHRDLRFYGYKAADEFLTHIGKLK